MLQRSKPGPEVSKIRIRRGHDSVVPTATMAMRLAIQHWNRSTSDAHKKRILAVHIMQVFRWFRFLSHEAPAQADFTLQHDRQECAASSHLFLIPQFSDANLDGAPTWMQSALPVPGNTVFASC